MPIPCFKYKKYLNSTCLSDPEKFRFRCGPGRSAALYLILGGAIAGLMNSAAAGDVGGAGGPAGTTGGAGGRGGWYDFYGGMGGGAGGGAAATPGKNGAGSDGADGSGTGSKGTAAGGSGIPPQPVTDTTGSSDASGGTNGGGGGGSGAGWLFDSDTVTNPTVADGEVLLDFGTGRFRGPYPVGGGVGGPGSCTADGLQCGGGGGGGAGMIIHAADPGYTLRVKPGQLVGGAGGSSVDPGSGGGGGGAGLVVTGSAPVIIDQSGNNTSISGGGGGTGNGGGGAGILIGDGVNLTTLGNGKRDGFQTIAGGDRGADIPGAPTTNSNLPGTAVIFTGDNATYTAIGQTIQASIAIVPTGGLGRIGRAIDMQSNGNKLVLGADGKGGLATQVTQSQNEPDQALVTIEGDNNSIELQPGVLMDGFVSATGTGTHLILGGTNAVYSGTPGAFALSDLGATEKYRGIAVLEKHGDVTWQLTGTQTVDTPWFVEDGVLQLGDKASIAAANRLTIGTAATPAGAVPTFDLTPLGRNAVTSVRTLAGTAQALVTDCIPAGRTAGTCGQILSHEMIGLRITDGQSDSYAGQINISGTLEVAGGTQIFTGNVGNMGGVLVSGGTVQLGDGTGTATLGTTNDPITVNTPGTLVVNNAGDWTLSARLDGDGTLTKRAASTLTIDQAGDFSGHAAIEAGTLRIAGADGALGAASIADAGVLVFDRTTDYTFAGTVTGAGDITKNQSSVLTLSGDSSAFTGATTVNAGTLAMSGKLRGTLDVKAGATLRGVGTDGSVGKTTLADNAILSGTHDTKLTFADDLTLSGNSIINASFSRPSQTELFDVTGNLTLDGTLNVLTLEHNGPGYYRLFHYGGTLQDNGLAIASAPTGVPLTDLSIVTTTPNAVDLYDSGGAPVGQYNFWKGGDGPWDTASSQWTDVTGANTGTWENGAFAFFNAAPGTVTVANAGGQVEAMGMQFTVDGYTVAGDPLTLTGNTRIVRVGDGTAAGASMTATILAPIAGNAAAGAVGLEKQGLGTLVLAGDNTYTGITKISKGTLRIGNGGATGRVLGDIVDDGTLAIDKSAAYDITGTISGSGAVVQEGTGTTRLSGHNSFSGGVTAEHGTVQAGADGDAFGSGILTVNADGHADLDNHDTTIGGLQGAGNVTLGSGSLTLMQNSDTVYSGVMSGTGGVVKNGHGALVFFGDNTYTGLTTINGGSVQIGDGGTSGTIAGDVAVTTADASLIVVRSDAFTFGGKISGEGNVIHAGSGTTTFTGDNSYRGDLFVTEGTVKAGVADHAFGAGYLSVSAGATADLAGFDTTTGGLLGAGNVLLDHATLTLDQQQASEFSGVMSGDGGLVKNGAGTLRLSGANSYGGPTAVNDGILRQGAAGAFSSASAYTVAAAGAMELGGFDTTLAALQNAGSVSFGGTGGATLTVNGNYAGQNGMLTINSVLEGDDSRTDRLTVKGDTSGATKLTVVNQGGKGAQTVNGIKVVEVDGASDGTFALQGHFTTDSGESAVVAGAYAYTLHQGGVNTPDDGDWYLRSEDVRHQPILNPGVPLYQGALQAMQTLNRLPTLQQRVGNRFWSGAANPLLEEGDGPGRTEAAPSPQSGNRLDKRALWGRIEGAHDRLNSYSAEGGARADMNTFLMQAGVDGLFAERESGWLTGGIYGQYGTVRSRIDSANGRGTVNTQGWGLGATLTWYGENGFYVDGQGQATWYRNDLRSDTAQLSLAHGRTGFGYALGVETGKRIALDGEGGNWTLTPQAQLIWSSATLDNFRDVWDTSVTSNNGDQLTGRLGLAANYRSAWRGNDGMLARTSVYGIANLYQDLVSRASVRVDGTRFSDRRDRTWGGVGLGGTYAWADDKYAVYGEGSVNTALNHFGDSYTLKANLGFRVSW